MERRWGLRLGLVWLACCVIGLPVLVSAASGDGQTPEEIIYLIVEAESGTLDETTLTLSGLPDYLLAVSETPEFFVAGFPAHNFLWTWQVAGDTADPLPAMLQIDEITVALNVTMLDYTEMDEVSLTVEITDVFDLLTEDPDAEPPATFAPARLVLRMDYAWYERLIEQFGETLRETSEQAQ